MSELQEQIRQRNRRELATFPTKVEPMPEETKRKIRKMFEREKRTHGIKQMMRGTENYSALKRQLFESYGIVDIHAEQPQKHQERITEKYVVLPSVSAPLTLNNIELFLNHNEYKPDAVCEKVNHSVVIENNGIKYRFINKVTSDINKKDIVAVFLIEEEWQFEDMRFRSPEECLNNCCCFHVIYPGQRLSVKDWYDKSKIIRLTVESDQKVLLRDSAKIFWKNINEFVHNRYRK